jgi:hypothetical protein
MIDFKGHRFEKDIILTCVRRYLAYPLSYWNLEGFVANIQKVQSRTCLRAQLSCQSHKLLISWYVLISQLPLVNHMDCFDPVQSGLG